MNPMIPLLAPCTVAATVGARKPADGVSTVDDTGGGREFYVRPSPSPARWLVRVRFDGGHWTAVELDEWGNFRRRLFDGREG